ncbi:YebF family protein [Sodalis sp. RH15]|uniref:YebF family protein n=1 Tax=Sodalis sp. RH15 TaxID=3394330 RepID=UPI0039B37CDE
MHKTGPGLLGALVLGLILSPLATAADQTQSGTAEPAAQSSSDAGSAAQSPSAQTQATPNATDNATPQPPATGQNSAPAAATPQTPSAAAPAQPSPPANAVPAPADTSPVPPPAPTDTAPAQPSAPANAVPAQPPAPANNSSAPAKPAPAKPAPAKPAPVKKATGDKSNAAKTTAAEQAKTAARNPPVQTFAVAPCPDLNATQVAELIQQDYTQNRFPRFADDKQALGDTMVAWINPEEVTGTGDSWQAPLKIRGQTADRSYGITLDCQKGVISYTLSK